MKRAKVIVLTHIDGTEEIVQKLYIKRVKENKEGGYTSVTIHGSEKSPDCILKVQEPALYILKKMISF